MKDITLCKTEHSLYFKTVRKKEELQTNEHVDGYLLDCNEKECRRIIDSLKGTKKLLAVTGQNNHFNRRALETMKINYLVSPERGTKKDTLKQRDSGLNHVLATIAKQKGITIVLDMSEIRLLQNKGLAKRLSRILQNIKVCRRAKCDLKIASFATKKSEIIGEKERTDFGTSLGMSSDMAKKAVEF